MNAGDISLTLENYFPLGQEHKLFLMLLFSKHNNYISIQFIHYAEL